MMAPIIQEKLSEISMACKAHGVKRLYVFGSSSRDDFNEKSDVDFISGFLQQSDPDNLEKLRNYYENMDRFQDQLVQIVARKVDLIQERAIKNAQLSAFIRQEKKLLYAAA